MKKTGGPSGFQAQIRGASLWDLVQIECLARKHRVVRVTTVGNVGYLYFDAGRIIHAETLEDRGESAAFQILAWKQGTFEACERDWPEVPSIVSSWETLLLRAAQAQDEQGLGKIVALPSKDSKEREYSHEVGTAAESPMSMKAPPGNAHMGNGNSGNSGSWNADDYEMAVRLAPNGDITAKRGEADDFANAVAYATRLVEILGEFMGLEGLRGYECTFKRGRCLLLKEPDGGLLSVKPRPDSDVSILKERIGL